MLRILMVAYEANRWGPARLPETFAEAGFEVATLSPTDNPVCASSFVKAKYHFAQLHGWRSFARTFQKVVKDWSPDLILPCDEQIVAMLHHLIRKGKGSLLSHDVLDLLTKSIGKTAMLDAMILKHSTRVLAERLGVPVPKSIKVTSADDAKAQAQKLGYPVYLKKSFGWSGMGAAACNNDAEVAQAYHEFEDRKPAWKKLLRKAAGRDWFPIETAIEVQKSAIGESVMYNIAAWQGKVLGGFFGAREVTVAANGPSTVVRLGQNAACAESARKMTEAFGISGFLCFDFVKCRDTGEVLLLECNPRPNQVNHLGKKLGVDMGLLLAKAIAGESLPEKTVEHSHAFALFPQEWFRDEQSALTKLENMDIPVRDTGLLTFLFNEGEKRGRSVQRLLDARQNELKAA